jgi:two-component SAPR family response regulator
METKSVLEQEYVYNCDSTGDFRVVRVSLDVTEMQEIVTLKPQENMTFSEVERVLKGFEDDILKKMQMKLEENHPTRLDYKGRLFKITFDAKTRGVTGFVPL